MPQKVSAGLLMYRVREGCLEVFLGHPGGPFFRYRDYDTWSIPKGQVEPGESPIETAMREFQEEVGLAPTGPYYPLGSIRQKGGKIVHAWAFAGAWEDQRELKSSLFELEFPPDSGRRQQFPEVDRVAFLPLSQAKPRLKAAQHPFLDRLEALLREAVKPKEA